MDQGLGQDRDAPLAGQNLSVFMLMADQGPGIKKRSGTSAEIKKIMVDKHDFHDIIDKV